MDQLYVLIWWIIGMKTSIDRWYFFDAEEKQLLLIINSPTTPPKLCGLCLVPVDHSRIQETKWCNSSKDQYFIYCILSSIWIKTNLTPENQNHVSIGWLSTLSIIEGSHDLHIHGGRLHWRHCEVCLETQELTFNNLRHWLYHATSTVVFCRHCIGSSAFFNLFTLQHQICSISSLKSQVGDPTGDAPVSRKWQWCRSGSAWKSIRLPLYRDVIHSFGGQVIQDLVRGLVGHLKHIVVKFWYHP